MSYSEAIDTAFGRTTFTELEIEGPLRPYMKDGRLVVPAEALRILAREAFAQAAFRLRGSHLRALARALEDPQASENDRLVIGRLLENALVASKGVLPLCQDTGTATVIAWKAESVHTGIDDEEALVRGAAEAYDKRYLRSSQVAARDMFDEFDSLNNLPAQVDLHAVPDGKDGPSYRFLFVAKGGGSSNKTTLFQMSKALLEESALVKFIREKIAALGVAACPPYRLAMVIGGTSPEFNLTTLKLATTELLDGLPDQPEGTEAGAFSVGTPYRDRVWEKKLQDAARESGLGAQFGGRELALDARVIRLSRHAGSCPVSIGVSCSAHRNILAEIRDGSIRIETLEADPGALLRSLDGRAKALVEARVAREGSSAPKDGGTSITRIDLRRSMEAILHDLRSLKAGDQVSLSGPLLVARDAAHLRWHEVIAAGKDLPVYLRDHPIYYAGPSATPPGKVIGSFGPTTAQRMDGYAEELMSRGVALVTLAKGNRAPSWANACARWGGVFLGTIGGAAALVSEDNITSSEVLDYPELGMEALRKIEVEGLLAFVVIDAEGTDLYAKG